MQGQATSAAQLRDYLSRGGQPVPQPPSIGLHPGEVQYFTSSFTGYTHEGKDVSYTQLRPLFLSPQGCLLWIMLLPINLLFKGFAAMRGGSRWRRSFGGALYVTNHRVVINDGHRHFDIGYGQMAVLRQESRGTYIAPHNLDAMILDVGRANDWLFVLLWHLSHGGRS